MGEYFAIRKKIEKIVRAAARIARRVDFEVSDKGDAANIVTTSDLNVQRFLCERLSRLIPDAGFFCEEENLKDTDSEYIFVIDPIDGTMNYSRAIPECVISVGLIRNKQPVVGVVKSIFRDDIFAASLGDGATRNGKPIHVSDKPFERSLLFTAMSLYKKELAPTCNQIIADAYSECSDIRRFGSCAIELCYIAAGLADLFFEMRVFPWDYAGAYLVLSEAGGILRGHNGEILTFDKPTPLIGANTLENYEHLNSIVNKYMDEVPY